MDAKLAGEESRTINDYSDFKLFQVESRISSTTASGLAFPPGGNPAPVTVKPQPWSPDDIWVRFLERDYRLSASAPLGSKGRDRDGGWQLNYDRKMLGFTQEQFKPIHEAARRLHEKLKEIDARKRTLMDAERAAHPEPPELNALNQQYKALLENEVANLKIILGGRAAATLDKYARTHFAQLAAHSPLPGFAGAQDPRIRSLRMYDLLLERVVAHDRATADREELGGMGGVYWPNIPRDNLAFTDQDKMNNLAFTEKQYEHVRVVAIRLAAAREERFAEWNRMFAAYSATTFASPEQKALNQQREDTIATELSDLRRALGPDLCAKLDAYFRVHYGL